MLRHLGLVLYGCLVAGFCSFFPPFCEPAFCESAKDWMGKGKEAYQAAKYHEAKEYYAKAIEMDPMLSKKQEEWVL
ncbi:MAG TPA: tetratricopeptide repeat protein, partial [Desulfomonilaceae bacterium]|nr:tetratricopeptide repeat protein [Desulfomonilaceae bacterium]